MKQYTQEVKECWDCPGHVFTRNAKSFCTAINRLVDTGCNCIPDWCPLEDVEESP